MDRRTLALVVAGLLIAFLLGFVPEWMAKRHADRDLATTRLELRLSRQQGRLGAALAESMRSNYERARQLMAAYFSDVQAALPAVADPRRRQTLEGILSQRDEIITLLSRAQPESTQRLMLLYTSMFTVVDPQGAVAPAVTPSPPPPPAAETTSAAPPSGSARPRGPLTPSLDPPPAPPGIRPTAPAPSAPRVAPPAAAAPATPRP